MVDRAGLDTSAKSIEAFGATCDGEATDDTAAIQAAIDAVPASGGTVYIPACASYYLSGNIVIQGKMNLVLEGRGGKIVWTGKAPKRGTSPSCTGSRQDCMIGFELRGNNTNITLQNLSAEGKVFRVLHIIPGMKTEIETDTSGEFLSGERACFIGFTGAWEPMNECYLVTVTHANRFTIPVNSSRFLQPAKQVAIGQHMQWRPALVWVADHAVLSHIQILNNQAIYMTNGIMISSSVHSTLDAAEIRGNRISHVFGSISGEGYGIQMGCGSPQGHCAVRWTDNVVVNAQRHSYYVANGEGQSGDNNVSMSHRLGMVPNPAFQLSAVSISRVRQNHITNLTIIDPWDTGFTLNQDIAEGQDSRQNRIEGLKITGLKKNRKAVVIGNTGGSDPARLQPLEDLVITDLYVETDNVSEPAVSILTGKHITLINPVIRRYHTTTSQGCITIYGIGESSGTARYSDHVDIIGMDCQGTGRAGSGIRFESAAATSGITVTVRHAQVSVPGHAFNFAVAQTNPNIHAFDSPQQGLVQR